MSLNDQTKHYEKQHRGTQADYEAYFAGMDASMQQKVALTTAHFPVRGRIADMGSGSGRGTYDLACLYGGLELVGVDINPVSVERAGHEFRRSNLSYRVGDISDMVFPAESLDGILNSSVLHHVTSFNDFDINRVFATLDNQVAQLKTGGVIIIRDFVIPDGPEQVYLDVPETDVSASEGIGGLSTSSLLELFARQWRSSVNRDAPVPLARVNSPRPGFARYELSLRAAAEFVLRKDYRADWEAEVLEEYTYLSQSQFEAAFRSRGLRIITSRPLWNPWIVQNRFEDKFYLSNLDGSPLPFPPTNYLIVGEKVSRGSGVELFERQRRAISTPGFFGLKAYRHKASGQVIELAERPNQTIDVVPWSESSGQVFVFAKKDFPRPVIRACTDQPRLNSATFSGYITEPISAIVEATGDGEQEVERILRERAGFSTEDIINIGEQFSYYTSPGGVNELVTSRLVEVRARETPFSFPNYTPFTDAGTVRELDAAQVLRACHVGGMFDARLEINIYRLLRSLGRKASPWIGAPIHLTVRPATFTPSASAPVIVPPLNAAFDEASPLPRPDFLSLREGSFAERDREGRILAEAQFEYVLPRSLSNNTLVVLPVVRTEGGVFVGIEHRDLPAVQSFSGNSGIATAPAWRLPPTVTHQSEIPSFLKGALERDFGLRPYRAWELGGPYFPTPGITPEIVYPYAVEVEPGGDSKLRFIHVEEISAQFDLLQDAHLLIAAYRLAHALGKLT
ncbi:MAG TPA: methyltransferase domain-containing protein [Pyrinomonadaceae bacterium]|nr:methyltransferase domain-containing protein [Pyrinomonadaceae bacterium]